MASIFNFGAPASPKKPHKNYYTAVIKNSVFHTVHTPCYTYAEYCKIMEGNYDFTPHRTSLLKTHITNVFFFKIIKRMMNIKD